MPTPFGKPPSRSAIAIASFKTTRRAAEESFVGPCELVNRTASQRSSQVHTIARDAPDIRCESRRESLSFVSPLETT